jgi:hypothetical protein
MQMAIFLIAIGILFIQLYINYDIDLQTKKEKVSKIFSELDLKSQAASSLLTAP